LQQCRAALLTIFARSHYLGAWGDPARRSIMVGMNKHLAAALVLGLAVSVLATPSFAQRSDGGEAGMSSAREKALRDCNGEAGKMSQGTWGHQQLDNYRTCMAQRGEQG
jgi:hypothetical protein